MGFVKKRNGLDRSLHNEFIFYPNLQNNGWILFSIPFVFPYTFSPPKFCFEIITVHAAMCLRKFPSGIRLARVVLYSSESIFIHNFTIPAHGRNAPVALAEATQIEKL